MKTLDTREFESLIAGASVLSADHHGNKVYRTPDDRVVKLFRRKRLLSTAAFVPYARRFANASRRLASMGIPAAEMLDIARVPSVKRHAVIYRWLEGSSLREALSQTSNPDQLMERFAAFIAMLHEHGVYFRGIHFGNVLVLADGRLALIDLSEVRFTRGKLRPWSRARNFRPLAKIGDDARALQQYGLARFVRAYINRTTLRSLALHSFCFWLTHSHTIFAGAKNVVDATPL